MLRHWTDIVCMRLIQPQAIVALAFHRMWSYIQVLMPTSSAYPPIKYTNTYHLNNSVEPSFTSAHSNKDFKPL